MTEPEPLTSRQQAIVPIAAFAAEGNLAKLDTALEQGLDAGLTINDTKEILVQVYAYAGFPRSLNALGTLMSVVETRKARGVTDEIGKLPSHPLPKGDALLSTGTANQTQLAGGVVQGPLFDFAPAIDEFLKTHLFGDIFSRDNLSWLDREIATLAMLAVLPGAEPQLQAHIAIAMNLGLTPEQLTSVITGLKQLVNQASAERAQTALNQHLEHQPYNQE
ncbi:carboxymuconolactone decarboxylase family protein [Shewanella algae]|uniref:carboxymuconolactone decarboxylase family protein n=1 Tax=Shewanella algae TaxID=38313 RepID=UPI0031F4C7CC